jgi:hypothetical protein
MRWALAILLGLAVIPSADAAPTLERFYIHGLEMPSPDLASGC